MSNANPHHNDPSPLCHIVTPVGMLGSGFDELQTEDMLAKLVATNVPTAIILDSGSTDSGPSKLALGCMSCPREAYTRDLAKLLELVDTFHVPLIFSSAGGDGSDEHVKEMLQVIQEIAEQEKNEHYRFKTVAIFSGIKKAMVRDRLRAGGITGCGPCVPPLTEEDIDSARTIVSQMGPEPFIDAMTAHPDFDVIVGGRAYDPAPYIAYASFLSNGLEDSESSTPYEALLGGFTHMGKIMECGGICAEPKSLGAVASVYRDGTFDISPLSPEARCTPVSVAAHTLYEKTRPDVLHGPGGYLDVTSATYEQLSDGRTVRVRGSLFHSSKSDGIPYQVKLEGATTIGYRSMFMGSVRDPILIDQLDTLLERVKAYVAAQHCDRSGFWELDFHVYGRNPLPGTEIFLIGEALASSQQLATSVACTARIATTHGAYPGQKATSGNFGFGIGGKTEIPLGACPKFSIYHLMDLTDGEERLWPSYEANDGGYIDCHDGNSIFSHGVSIFGNGKARQHSSLKRPSPLTHDSKNGTFSEEKKPQVFPSPKPSHPDSLSSPTRLGHLARVLRSKDAGPYEITFDVMFDSESVYHLIRQSDLLSPEAMADALTVPQDDIIWCGFFDPARAFKATIPRVRAGKKVAAGSFMEDDVHGSQQHLGLVNVELPKAILEELERLEKM